MRKVLVILYAILSVMIFVTAVTGKEPEAKKEVCSMTAGFYLEGRAEFGKLVLKTFGQHPKNLVADQKHQIVESNPESAALLSGDLDTKLTQGEITSTQKSIVVLHFTGKAKKLIVSANGWNGTPWEKTQTLRLTSEEAKSGRLVFRIDPVTGSIAKSKEVKKK
ncbi:MAG: hypothetical protein M1429_01310 [Patescibacteria group bacterium]|nr:hypothetical protein [Patescibacteria group bacterium]